MAIDQLVVWNRHAGSVGAAQDIRHRLEINPRVQVYEPRHSADATRHVSQAIQEGVRRVVAAGGDGTINSVINGLRPAASEVTLGVLPLGTANDWCRSLGIPNDIEEAWDILQRGMSRKIDLIKTKTHSSDRWFANIATGGNSQRVTEAMTDELKQRWGAFCYVRGAIEVLADLESFKTKITLEGAETIELSVWNILIANGKTSAGNLKVAPRADLTDGLLDVVIIEEGTALDLADLTSRYLFDDYISSEKVFYRQTSRILIESSPPIYFSIDGDLIEEQPVSFQILPQALNVIVGDEFDALQGALTAVAEEAC